jgi:hypothetical protein
MSKKFISALALAATGCGLSSAAMADTEVAPNTTVGGQMFADFGYIKNQQNGNEVNPTGVGFDIKRFYLIVDHRFNDVWSADLTTDAQYINSPSITVNPAATTTTTTSTTNSGAVAEVFIKKLYLQAKFSDAFVLHAGSFTSPWAPFAESLYAYRWVEKTTTDRLGFANTADWGIHATGAFAQPGINYALSVVNGAGYKNPSRSKDVDVEGMVNYVSPFGVTVGAGFYTGHLGQVNAVNQDFAKNTASRWNVAIGYTIAGFRVGGEYFNAKNYKTVNNITAGVFGTSAVIATTATGVVPTDKTGGGSVWASYAITDQYNVFARYDDTTLSKDVLSSLKDKYFNVGFGYKPVKQVDLALVYKYEKVDHGVNSISGADANGSYTIGGTNAASSGKFSEVGVYFAYKY